MSHNLVRAVWERKDLDASERLVLLSLADHADEDGFCYPSVKRICERTSLAERTVQGTIKKLVGRGFVSVRYGQGRNGTNAFVVNATPAADAPPQYLHPAANAPRSCCATPPQLLRHPPAAAAPKPSLNHQED
ncbi:MAG: helix-turn-helix domain-containing protein, partial [Roseomonas sp.]|nr:helix-turn-helix domain-containing protein [Roseomonas sp.]